MRNFTYLNHNFKESYINYACYICEKCGCIAHIANNNKYYQRDINSDNFKKWIELLSCEENIIKNIIE